MEIKILGKRWVDTFRNVNDFYINVSRMLLNADDIMQRKGYYPHAWNSFYPVGHKLAEYKDWPMWLPEFVIRQYYAESNEKEIFTIGAFLHLLNNVEFEQPLCIVSRMLANNTPDEIYWIAMSQGYRRNPLADGKVYVIGESFEDFLFNKTREAIDGDIQIFKEVVSGGKLLSMALPLLEITNLEQLEKRLVLPLLENKRWPL